MMRAKPILATAVVSLSLAACQWMGGDQQQSGAQSPQTSAATSQRYPGAAMAQQSAAPQMIQQVQRNLGQRGYDVGPVDGVWGDSTQTALRNFQRDQGLAQSGQIDAQTLAALGVSSQQQGQTAQRQQQQQWQQPQQQQQQYTPTNRRSGAQQQSSMMQGQQSGQQRMAQQAAAPDLVRNVQQELQQRGYETGRVDGMWGRNTAQALRSFQSDQNIEASGRINDQTLAALGITPSGQELGSRPQSPNTDLQMQQRRQQDQLGESPMDQPQITEPDQREFEQSPEADLNPSEPDIGPRE